MALCGSMPLPILGPLGQNCLTTHLGSQGPTEAIIAPIPSSGSYKPNTLWEMIWSCRECLDIYQHGHLREYSQTPYFDSILVAAMSWFRVDDIFYMFSKFVHEKSGSSESTRKHTQSLEQRVQVRSWFLNPYQTISNYIGIWLEVGSHHKKMQFPAELITRGSSPQCGKKLAPERSRCRSGHNNGETDRS